MIAKELPCPHCGQNLNLEANATDQLRAADELAKAMKRMTGNPCDRQNCKSRTELAEQALAAFEKARGT